MTDDVDVPTAEQPQLRIGGVLVSSLRAQGLPEWIKRWPCDRCAREIVKDAVYRLPSTGELVCGRCFMLADVHPGDVEERIKRPSAGRMYPNGARFTPRDYQAHGIRFLSRRRVALLQDAPGLGKTCQVLRAIPEGYGLCVVCPKSLTKNWARETTEWRPELFHLPGTNPEWTPGGPGYATFVHYERVRALKRIIRPRGPVVLVIDEAQRAKNPNNATTQSLRLLRDAVLETGGRVWEATATPWENDPQELWSVLQNALLGHAAFPVSGWPEFEALFEAWWRTSGASGEEERMAPSGSKLRVLFDRLGQIGNDPGPEAVRIRRLKKDVLKELPPKRYERVECSIAKADARVLTRHTRALVAHARAWEQVRDGSLRDPEAPGLDDNQRAKRYMAVDALAAEILSGLQDPPPQEARRAVELALKWKNKNPSRGVLMEVRRALAVAKIPGLIELVERYEEHGEPVLVFSAHRQPIEIVAARRHWGAVMGGMSEAKRQRAIDRFQAGDLRGLGVTIKAGGVGLTLTRSATAIFCDREWTETSNRQAEDRIHRLGQLRECTIVTLVADHAVDQRVDELLGEKTALIEALDGEVGG